MRKSFGFAVKKHFSIQNPMSLRLKFDRVLTSNAYDRMLGKSLKGLMSVTLSKSYRLNMLPKQLSFLNHSCDDKLAKALLFFQKHPVLSKSIVSMKNCEFDKLSQKPTDSKTY